MKFILLSTVCCCIVASCATFQIEDPKSGAAFALATDGHNISFTGKLPIGYNK